MGTVAGTVEMACFRIPAPIGRKPPPPPSPKVSIVATLSCLPRPALEAIAEVAIELLNARDPDPDIEPETVEENGDEDDGPAPEWRPWMPVKRTRFGALSRT
ncbi:MAG: hypothetical protein INR62_07570 [Rhodospirillales bacterium]|nr:hypothetical protein [Acetobacter sp.]